MFYRELNWDKVIDDFVKIKEEIGCVIEMVMGRKENCKREIF